MERFDRFNRRYGLYLHALSIAFWCVLIVLNFQRYREKHESFKLIGFVIGIFLLAASTFNLVRWLKMKRRP